MPKSYSSIEDKQERACMNVSSKANTAAASQFLSMLDQAVAEGKTLTVKLGRVELECMVESKKELDELKTKLDSKDASAVVTFAVSILLVNSEIGIAAEFWNGPEFMSLTRRMEVK